MPFASEAQHRYMRAQHPQIAQKWTDEMRGGKKASKHQKEHPIKHANLPEKVGKGHVAIGKRLNSDGEVSKAVLRASVAPRLARKAPAAGTNGRRFITGDQNSTKIIGKVAVEKASWGGLWRSTKGNTRAFSGGFKAGVADMAPKSILPSSMTSGFGRAVGSGEKVGAFVRKRPVLAGAGALGTAGVGGYAVGKRHGDPEDARYARLGAASAAGAMGAGMFGYHAAKGPYKLNRALAKDKHLQAQLKNRAGMPATSAPVKNLLEALGSGKPGVMIGRRQAILGAGALGSAGLSVAAGRKASDRRWN